MSKDLRAYSTLDVKAAVDGSGERIITGIASTPDLDTMGDVVEPKGAQFKLPLTLLFNHKMDQPIGTVTKARATPKGITFTARIAQVSDAGILKDRVDEAWHSLKAGIIRGVSIGFKPIERTFTDTGIHFHKWLWLELSLVAVPANMQATISTVKSLYREQAALGTPQTMHKTVSPRVGGPPKPENNRRIKVTTITDQLKDFRNQRKEKASRLEELGTSLAQNGELQEHEQDEFDTLRSEIKSVDDAIDRLEYTQTINIKNATQIMATDSDAGIEQRSSLPAQPKRQPAAPGIAFAQYVKCLAKANGIGYVAEQIAKDEYSYDPRIAGLIKAAVSGGVTTPGTDYAGSLSEPQTLVSEFIELLRARSIIGRFGTDGIPALRSVPFNVKVQRQTGGFTGAWTGEGAHSPVSSAVFDSVTMGKTKVTATTSISDEMLRFANIAAETTIRNDLVAAIVERLDTDFVDSANAGVANIKPASIVNGVTGIASAGDDAVAVRTDLQNLMNRFAAAKIRTSGKVLIMSEELKIALMLLRNSLGQAEFPEINENRLAGFNVIASDNVPAATVVAVSPNDILLADDESVDVRMSDQATLEMDTAPGGEISTPTGATGAMVNMFQAEAVAIKASRFVNWVKGRPEAAQLLTAATWNGAPAATVAP